MAEKVTPESVNIDGGLPHLMTFNWIYGFCLSIVMYWVLNLVAPDKTTLIPQVVHGTPPVVDSMAIDGDSERQMSYHGNAKPSMEVSGAKEVVLVASA